MLGKLRYHPDAAATLQSAEVRRRLFNAYAGALYLDRGLSAVERWLCVLVTPESGEPPFKRIRSSQGAQAEDEGHRTPPVQETLPESRSNIDTTLASSPFRAQQQATPSFGSQTQQTAGTTDVDHPTSPSHPLAPPTPLRVPAQPERPFLPHFHQSAADRGVKLEYTSEYTGLAHAGEWTVQCIVNGICKGVSRPCKTKQAGREDAARKAYAAMGWAGAPGLGR